MEDSTASPFLENATTTAITTNSSTVLPTVSPSVATTSQSQPLIDVDEQEEEANLVCPFCPNGAPLSFPDQQFITTTSNTQQPDTIITCGSFAALVQALQTQEECDATLSVFEGLFDPTIYCQCPTPTTSGTTDGLLCPLCGSSSRLELASPDILSQTIINSVTCQDYVHLAASATSEAFCQSILDVEGIQDACCTSTSTTLEENNENGSGESAGSLADFIPEDETQSTTTEGNNEDISTLSSSTKSTTTQSAAAARRPGMVMLVVIVLMQPAIFGRS